MHYRTDRVSFLETEDEFLALRSRVEGLDRPSFDTDELPAGNGPLTVVPAAP
jgi:hypothetical protein